MGVVKRGRVSAADLAIVPMTPIGTAERLKPPHDLSDEEVELWVAVTSSQSLSGNIMLGCKVLRSMRGIEARRKKASPLRLRFSQSLASRRHCDRSGGSAGGRRAVRRRVWARRDAGSWARCL
jgi:hypothetical protein